MKITQALLTYAPTGKKKTAVIPTRCRVINYVPVRELWVRMHAIHKTIVKGFNLLRRGCTKAVPCPPTSLRRSRSDDGMKRPTVRSCTLGHFFGVTQGMCSDGVTDVCTKAGNKGSNVALGVSVRNLTLLQGFGQDAIDFPGVLDRDKWSVKHCACMPRES